MNAAALPSPAPVGDAVVTTNPVDVADYFLSLLLARKATSVWFDPSGEDGHVISVDLHRETVQTLRVDRALGDAVIARIALLAGLDLVGGNSQAGTFLVQQGGRSTDVVMSTRSAAGGLSGELRLFADRPTPVTRSAGGGNEALPEFLEPNARVGAYQIVAALGRGGMGVVYEVEHLALGRRFALKILSGEVMDSDPASARRFVREARAAARIRHPGIVDVTDFGTLHDGRPFLVMEKLEGNTLQDLVASQGALNPLRATRLLRAVAEALAVAHDRGVVHRDITPANVFVLGAESGDPSLPERVVLVDFGSAHTPDPEHTDIPDGPNGTVIGTPHYMAPEMIRGRPSDARTDLYALGTVLYELVTGVPPYDGESPRAIAIQHLQASIPHLHSPHGELPDEMVQLAATLMAKNPEDRPRSAIEVVSLFTRVEILLSRRGWRRWLP